ncbi:MAG: bacteriophage abortive infection AbiH family protein [Bacteroidota bacterium]
MPKDIQPIPITISTKPEEVDINNIVIAQGKCHRNSYTVARRNTSVKIIEGFIITHDEFNEEVALPHVWNKFNNKYFDVTSDHLFEQNMENFAKYFEIVEHDPKDLIEGELFQFSDTTKFYVVVSNIAFSKKLYIIGNGFDLFNQIKSRYWDFREYVQETDKKLFENIEKYFDPESLWSDFEQTLADLNTDKIVEEASNYLMSYSDENWRDSGHHDYQYEVRERINLITEELRNKFVEWIGGLQINMPENILSLNRKSAFICFNYTATLERIYKISEHYILYIHNKYLDPTSKLILGHGKKIKPNENMDPDEDIRVVEGNKIIDQYFIDTYKSTENIILENKAYFENLTETEDVYVLGHSLSDVDLPYFTEICKYIDTTKVKWYISCHNRRDKEHHSNVMNRLGISDTLLSYDQIDSLDTGKYTQLKLEL